MPGDAELLSDGDRSVLELEAGWWMRPGPKDAAIRSALGLSPSAYYRRLRALCDSSAAYAHFPLVVRRLQRRRAQWRRRHFEGVAASRQRGDEPW